MNLSDPAAFERAYDEHARGAYRAAYRVLGDAAQAQDVVQDVFLKLWRQPGSSTPRRGELGSYLRLMARSRALDLWREGQAAGRASDRLKLGVARRGGAPTSARRSPPSTRRSAHGPRRPARAARRAARGVVLAYWGGLTADQIARRSNVPLGTAKSRIRLGLARAAPRVRGHSRRAVAA